MKDHLEKWLMGLHREGKPDEFEAKGLLQRYQVAVPKGVRLFPGEEPDCRGLKPPFAVKVCSSEHQHKTEIGGVLAQVPAAQLSGTVETLRSRFPEQPVLIEEQISFQGVECIIGAMNDQQFGPVVMAGTGGVLTELIRDVSFRLAPCSRDEALGMLRELVIAPVFEGFRGSRLDGRQLAAMIARLAELAMDFGAAFSSVDINPVVFSQGRWIALDASIAMH